MYPHGKAIKGKGEGLLLIMGLTGSVYPHGEAANGIKGKGEGLSLIMGLTGIVYPHGKAIKGKGEGLYTCTCPALW